MHTLEREKPKYIFKNGRPSFLCPPYSNEELQILREHLLSTRGGINENPIAVFISGLPGSGKSSCTQNIMDCMGIDRSDLVDIDFDLIRNFHETYRVLLNPIGKTTLPIESFLELVPWFMEGTNFEHVLFQRENSIISDMLSRKISFIMKAILSTAGCYEWVQYVRESGYTILFIHVDCSIQEAMKRAEFKAYQTGRWSSPDFISSKEAGLLEWLPRIANFVQNQCGSESAVALYDNSIWNHPPICLYNSRNNFEPVTFEEGDLEHIGVGMVARLRDFAFRYMSLIFPDQQNTHFHLAGGCYKFLLTGKLPSDFDIWPATENDYLHLCFLLEENSSARLVRKTRFNAQYEIFMEPYGQSSNSDLYVDIVVRTHETLQETLDNFDLAISAVGVTFQNGCIREHIVHPLFFASLLQKQPLLILPMPNKPFLLATAERVLRYSNELNFPFPCKQMKYLLEVFSQETPGIKEEMILAHNEVSRGGEQKENVKSFFNIP